MLWPRSTRRDTTKHAQTPQRQGEHKALLYQQCSTVQAAAKTLRRQHRHRRPRRQLGRYHKPFQQKQRKRLYQYQQAPPVPLICSTNRTNEAMATMDATESALRTPLWVTGRTASSFSSGQITNPASQNISMIMYTILSPTLALCIAIVYICMLSIE